jgi:DNA-binding IclR family transcriptional regulator
VETAQTADYALLVLIELQAHDGQTVAELAASLSLNRSVIQRIMVTLHRRSMVTKGIGGRFYLGPQLIAIAQHVPDELTGFARPYLRELAVAVEEMAVLTVQDIDDALIVAHHNGSTSALRVEYEIGTRHPLSQGASGLAILAHLNHPGIDSGMERRLRLIREAGYARTEGEIKDQMIGLAAPLITETLGCVGSLALILPSIRATKIDEALIVQLRQTASALSSSYDDCLRAKSAGPERQLASS